MSRVAFGPIVVFAVCAFPVGAQPKAPLTFEVASLRPTQGASDFAGIRPAPGGERYVASNMSLRLLLMVAWSVKPEQINGGPSWVDSDRWDMQAKAERPSSTEELHAMLENLLVERFQLKFHRDTKELPAYVLSVDKNGPKLTPHSAQNAGEQWIDTKIERVVQVKMTATLAPMRYFAWRLSQALDRPVIDRTGLTGGFDFTLSYTRDLPPGMRPGALLNGEPIDTSGLNIFEALRQQLGLDLKPQRGPVEVYVIDHAEKPAAVE